MYWTCLQNNALKKILTWRSLFKLFPIWLRKKSLPNFSHRNTLPGYICLSIMSSRPNFLFFSNGKSNCPLKRIPIQITPNVVQDLCLRNWSERRGQKYTRMLMLDQIFPVEQPSHTSGLQIPIRKEHWDNYGEFDTLMELSSLVFPMARDLNNTARSSKLMLHHCESLGDEAFPLNSYPKGELHFSQNRPTFSHNLINFCINLFLNVFRTKSCCIAV